MKSRARKKESRLKDEQILKELEELAERLSVTIHYEKMKAFEFRIQDGCCKLEGAPHIYIDRKRSTKEKIHILADELKRFDLENTFIPPLLREKILLLPNQTETHTDYDEENQSDMH